MNIIEEFKHKTFHSPYQQMSTIFIICVYINVKKETQFYSLEMRWSQNIEATTAAKWSTETQVVREV